MLLENYPSKFFFATSVDMQRLYYGEICISLVQKCQDKVSFKIFLQLLLVLSKLFYLFADKFRSLQIFFKNFNFL